MRSAFLSHNNVALVNSYSSETPNNYLNLEIIYCQILERREVINFHIKPEVHKGGVISLV